MIQSLADPGDRADSRHEGSFEDEPSVAVRVVILQWGRSDETVRCLEALARTCGVHATPIVVDNGSDAPHRARIEERFPDVRLVANGENLGFAEGNNRVLRRLIEDWKHRKGPRYCLLLNNDLEVGPQTLREMVEVMQATGAGAVGAVNRERDRPGFASSGGFIRWPSGRYRDVAREAAESGSRSLEVDAVCGSTLLLDLEALVGVGVFDPEYFCVYEETDLCLRLARAGHPVVLACRARTVHAVGKSTGRALHFYFRFRNRVRFVRRHRGERGFRRMLPGYLLEVVLRIALYLPLFRFREARAIFLGARDGLLGRGGPGPLLGLKHPSPPREEKKTAETQSAPRKTRRRQEGV